MHITKYDNITSGINISIQHTINGSFSAIIEVASDNEIGRKIANNAETIGLFFI